MAEQEPQEIGQDAETGGGILSKSELDALLAAAEGEQPAGAGGGAGDEWDAEPGPQEALDESAPDAPSPVVSLPSFDLPPAYGGQSANGAGGSGMSRVRDIPLDVSVELGRTRLLIKDILDLGAGSIIELDKLAGEPVDLFANGLLVARGEVIVIDDNFGVRVTEIITAAERRQLQDAEADALAA